MGYLYIIIALLAGATKGFMGKKISNTVATYKQSVFVNMLRMFICIAVSVVSFMIESGGKGFVMDKEALIYGAFAGITLSVFIITWLLAVRHGAFMLISVSQMFGVVVTLICSYFVFRDPIAPKQLVAVLILIAAVLIMASYSSIIKGKLSVAGIVLIAICGLSSGVHDFSIKLFTYYSEANVSVLNLVTYVVSGITLAIMLLMPSGDSFDKKALFKSEIFTVLIMSVCLFINSYFKAAANNYLPVAQVYPLNQAGGLILSAAMSSVFFKEKMTPRCAVGMVLAFIAVILLK